MAEGVLEITLQNFESAVVRSPVPFMLLFQSAQYPSCRSAADAMQKLAEIYRGRAGFGVVDADAQPALAGQLHIAGLPCVLVLHGGRLCAHVGGPLPLSHYRRLLDRLPPEGKEKRRKRKWFR